MLLASCKKKKFKSILKKNIVFIATIFFIYAEIQYIITWFSKCCHNDISKCKNGPTNNF